MAANGDSTQAVVESREVATTPSDNIRPVQSTDGQQTQRGTTEHHADLPRAPDGGWGYVVLLGVMIVFGILGGIARSATLIFRAFQQQFGKTASETAIITTLGGICRFMSSPVASYLCNRYGVRRSVICGTVLCTGGFLGSAFAPSLYMVYITQGVIQGFGSGLVTTGCFVIVGLYFDKKKAKANSIATSGLSVGGMVCAPLVVLAFKHYGYTGTMMILGGLTLHFFISASLFRPLRMTKAPRSYEMKKIGVDSEQTEMGDSGKLETEEVQEKVTACETTTPLVTHPGDTGARNDDLGYSCNNEHSTSKTCRKNDSSGTQDLRDENDNLCIKASKRHCGDNCNQRTMQCPEEENEKCPDKVKEKSTAENEHIAMPKTVQRGRAKIKKSVCKHLDLALLKERAFLSFAVLMVGMFACGSIMGLFLAGIAAERGITDGQLSLLLVIACGADLAGRVLAGVVFDLRLARDWRLLLFAVAGLLFSLLAALMPVSHDLPSFAIILVLRITFAAIFHSQHLTILSDMVGRARFASAVGLSRFFQGIGIIIGPPLGGLLRDKLGSYSATYIYGGVISGISTLILVCVNYKTMFCSQSKQNGEKPTKQGNK